MKRHGIVFDKIYTTALDLWWRDCKIIKTHLSAEGVEYTEFRTEVYKDGDPAYIQEVVIAPTRTLILVRPDKENGE